MERPFRDRVGAWTRKEKDGVGRGYTSGCRDSFMLAPLEQISWSWANRTEPSDSPLSTHACVPLLQY
jgi:hypothetical protein